MENNLKIIKINMPLDTYVIEAIDTNTDFRTLNSNSFKITTGSINEESNYSLDKNGIATCEDFFTTTSDEWGNPVQVEISDSNYSFVTTVKMEKNNLVWTLTNGSYSVNIEQGVLEKNSNGKRGDLNFLALSFCLSIFSLSNGVKFLNRSNDKDIIKSLNTFKFKINS